VILDFHLWQWIDERRQEEKKKGKEEREKEQRERGARRPGPDGIPFFYYLPIEIDDGGT